MLVSSPRPWGCFYYAIHGGRLHLVFPTPVGVFPMSPIDIVDGNSLPHARGGVSKGKMLTKQKAGSSPRPWGCFLNHIILNRLASVFPTPVGVFLLAIA